MGTGGVYKQLGPGPFEVSDLHLLGKAFDSPASGGASDEYIGAFTTPPATLGTGTVQSGVYYHVSAAAPVSVGCGGRDLVLDWTAPMTGIGMEFGNGLTAATVGGVELSLSSAQLGGIIRWPARGNGRMLPGERVMSDVLPTGRYAVFTYLSGPSNANAPFFETLCGVPARSGIGLHRSNVSVADQPITWRLDFLDAVCLP
ncbi:hypothetical protein [Streptomyces sp. H27-H5]|uniref:hypothetical protein n=1 Tax=Streptomyces sp. H27-H5 TaxID=2996460 RepID=UPI00227215E8|nr:hypothetical protein [Streptomyces sp. H27-H5]MCY0957739.1 hypothetical protein [Streptomyces sp. H27-H5]